MELAAATVKTEDKVAVCIIMFKPRLFRVIVSGPRSQIIASLARAEHLSLVDFSPRSSPPAIAGRGSGEEVEAS